MKNFKIKVLVCILGLFILTACGAQDNIESKQTEEGNQIYSSAQASLEETSSTPTPMQSSTPNPTPIPKGDIPERSYPSHRDFSYENMEFVDDQTYAFLKEIYDEIDFYGEFELGDTGLYDEYIAQYKKLVENEINFTVTETGEKYYLKEYKSMNVREDEVFDPSDFVYYLFDMDGDGTPELCMWNLYTYIFKYDVNSGDMILWHEIETCWEQILGTRKLWWGWEGMRYTMVELDDNGNMEMGVYFLIEAFWSNGNETYLISVPVYADESKQIDLPKEMKQQAYFSEDSQVYMFNVTEEQFDELTGDFFEACKLSEENLKKVAYNYEDLFSEGNLDTITRTVTSFAYSTDGAELMGVYSNNGELQYLNVDVLGEMGRRIYEYTFTDNSIIYTDIEIFYAEPFYVSGAETEIKEINYKKYILSDGRMYEVIDDKAMVQVPEELLLETEDIMEDFVRELENCTDRIENEEGNRDDSLRTRTIKANTSEVGSQSTENADYALYPSNMKESNIGNINQYMWSEMNTNIYFPQVYYSNEYPQYNFDMETKINQELFLQSIGNENSFLLTRDIRGLVEYNMDYAITKADEEIFSIKYLGDICSVDHQHWVCSGMTIDVQTGEKINLSEFIVLDEDLARRVEKGEILYEDEAGYEVEFVISCIESFIDNFNNGIEDAYSCYYLEEDTINLIVPMYQGNANYIMVKIPIES